MIKTWDAVYFTIGERCRFFPISWNPPKKKSPWACHIQAPPFYISRDFSYTPLKFGPQHVNLEQQHEHLVQVAARDNRPLLILEQKGPKITTQSTKIRCVLMNYNRSFTKLFRPKNWIYCRCRKHYSSYRRRSMWRVPGLAEGSPRIQHLIHWPDPHRQNRAQQCAQASRAGEDTECESEAIRAMACNIRPWCCGMLLFHFEIVDISRKGVKQVCAYWIRQYDEVEYLSKVL